jgi:hypothetical protein
MCVHTEAITHLTSGCSGGRELVNKSREIRGTTLYFCYNSEKIGFHSLGEWVRDPSNASKWIVTTACNNQCVAFESEEVIGLFKGKSFQD